MSKKTKVIVRRSTKGDGPENGFAEESTMTEREQIPETASAPEDVGQTQKTMSTEGAGEAVLDRSEVTTQPSQTWAPVSGFNLENANRNHQYFIRSMLVFADCCLQRTPEGIFDVLGRNFDSPGFMAWWLNRIGKGHFVSLVKGKDMVDAVRKVAHELHRELKHEIGRPVPRW